MKIGIIGGTGGMGKGFAIRLCKKHHVIIGSRDAGRAATAASEYSDLAKTAYGNINGAISGKDNLSVAKESQVLILSIHMKILMQLARNYYLRSVMNVL